MKTATLTETKNQLSALIDQIRHGESVLILDPVLVQKTRIETRILRQVVVGRVFELPATGPGGHGGAEAGRQLVVAMVGDPNLAASVALKG